MLIGILSYVRIFTIVVAVAMYLFVWWYLYKHFDEFVRTGYGYPCFERFMGYFYFVWIMIHVLAVFGVCVYSWLVVL